MTDMFFSMMRFFGATLLVAVLAWFATKKLAGASRAGRKSENLSVVESVNLGGYATVQLVRVGEKYFAVGVTREQVTFLAEVEGEQISEPAPVEYNSMNTPFGKVLSRFIAPKETPGDEEGKDD